MDTLIVARPPLVHTFDVPIVDRHDAWDAGSESRDWHRRSGVAEAIVTSRIGDGPTIKLEVTGAVDTEEDVGALSRIVPFESVVESVASVSQAMTDALRRAKPEEAEVTFGLDVTLEAGNLTSMIVKGGGRSTFTIRLLWKSA
jgi:Trypsin-co-occurring domain 1